ncbi:MAG TPA: L-lactate permease [Kofleriaceae bacterium]|nr:L-lactate permease [Kofleriaceae bacterium]
MSLALSAALAATPIAVLLGSMLGLRWSTAVAGTVALVVALIIGFAGFAYGADELGPARAVIGALAEAGFSAFSIAWILLPALAIHHLQQRTGSIETLQRALRRATDDPAIAALLIAWFFALFLEGAAGFGTPVALAAPFLVSAGLQPIQAVALVLIGHAAGVSFGAIGTPIQAQAVTAGIDPLELARATGLYVAILGWVVPLAMMVMVRRDSDAPASPRGRALWLWAVAAAALFIAPYFAISRWVGPELPTLVGGLAGGVTFAMLWQLRGGRGRGADDPPLPARRVLRASAPYLLVVAIVLITRLIEPIREALAVRWEWSLYARFDGDIRLLQHPGTLLLGSLVLGALVQRASPRAVGSAIAQAARRLIPVVVALIAVLALSRVMVHAGMIDALARAAARAPGPVWAMLAPFVGVLGTFVTGSATASNLLFTELQAATAAETDLEIPRALAAQGFGAAAGNMIAPMNLVAGAATVGLVGREGEILRRTLGVCIGYGLLGGLVTWLLR